MERTCTRLFRVPTISVTGRPLAGATRDESGLFGALPARHPQVHRRRQVWRDVERRADESEVGERLREVAEEALRLRVVLLRQQAEVVRKAGEPLEERQRLLVPSQQLVTVGEPERAGEEHALPRRQAVDTGLLRPVAEHEAVLQQLALDRFDRAADARVGGR